MASLGSITNVIKQAEPTNKAQLYGDLEVRLTYRPDQRLVSAEVDLSRSCTSTCRRGDLNPEYMIVLREDLEIS